jgi:hypothetical protein
MNLIVTYELKFEFLNGILLKIQGKDKRRVKMSLSMPWKHVGGIDVQLYSFLTSILYGGVWTAARPGRFTTNTPGAPVPVSTAWGGDKPPIRHSNPGLSNRSLIIIMTMLSVMPFSGPKGYYAVWTGKYLPTFVTIFVVSPSISSRPVILKCVCASHLI